MILELRVRELATIADVTLELGEGLNVLTGETGAGKSMLVDALALLLGDRADPQVVRPGASRAVVEGVFQVTRTPLYRDIEDLGLDLEEDRLIIRREVQAAGRSRAWVNGSPTTVQVLARLGEQLVDLHGQHETQSLLRADAQRDLLDAFGNAEREREAVAAAWAALADLERAEADLAARRDEARRRADYLRHVVREIDQARVKPGEEQQLAEEAHRLTHAGQLVQHARQVADLLDGEDASALAALSAVERALTALERIDPATASWRELADTAYTNLTELARVAAEYAANVQEDPARLDQVQSRRDTLSRLTQKYGATLDDVLATRTQAAVELELLDTADTDLRALGTRRQAAAAAFQSACRSLSERRAESADRLARQVNRQLARLGLPGGRLSVQLDPLESPGSFGGEAVTFVVALNAGMEPRPLARSASGGELSRLMLALKVALAAQDAIPTLVFDEVDQGIGGEIGSQVGEALAQVAARRQVLVITHLAQIAARADRHLVVSKATRGGVATSVAQPIYGEDRVQELARMLGDAESPEARRHAQAILKTMGSPVKNG